jgi:hypothetical protein
VDLGHVPERQDVWRPQVLLEIELHLPDAPMDVDLLLEPGGGKQADASPAVLRDRICDDGRPVNE